MSLPRREASSPDAAPDLAAVLAGEADALDRWYREQWPPVYRLAIGILGQPSEAQDLAQEAMMHLTDHLDEYDPRRSWPAWRNTIVTNLCRDRLRRRAARDRAETAASEEILPRVLPDPGEAAAAAEIHRILLTALERLTPREREVFVLRDLEERPAPEVAATLGIQATTVRTLLSLARRRLRDLLGPRLAPAGPDGHLGPETRP